MADEDTLFEEFEAIAGDSPRAATENLICFRFSAKERTFFAIVASVRAYLNGNNGLKAMVMI